MDRDWYEFEDSGMTRSEWDGTDPDARAAASSTFDQTREEVAEKVRKARGFTITLAMEGEDGESFQVETIHIGEMLPKEIILCMMESQIENVAFTHFSHCRSFDPSYAYPLLSAMAASVAKVQNRGREDR